MRAARHRAISRLGRGLAVVASLALFACAGPSPDDDSGIPPLRREGERKTGARAAQGTAPRPTPAPPPAPATPEEALRRADERVAAGDDAGARRILAQAIAQQPSAAGSDRVRLRLATLEQRAGQLAAATSTLAPIRVDALAPAEREAALRLQALLAAGRRDAVAELLALARLRAEVASPDVAAMVDVDLAERIARMSQVDLQRSADALGERPPAARVRLRIAENALAQKQLGVALLALAQAARLPLTPDESAHLDELEAAAHRLEESGEADVGPGTTIGGEPGASDLPVPDLPPAGPLPSTQGAKGTLGVVVPLSGAKARFGEETLNGVLIAADLFRPDAVPGEEGLRIVVRDTRSTSDGAAAAVAELATMPDVLAAIGPVTADEADAAAVAAEATALPLLALSPRENVTEGRTRVLRLGVSPRAEAESLAAYAVGGLALRRFAILHPDDAYGRGLADVFEQSVRGYGGEIVGRAAYGTRTVDFGDALRVAAGGRLPAAIAAPPAGAGTAGTTGSPGATGDLAAGGDSAMLAPAPPPFDALFVPDARDRIEILAPQIAMNGITGARLLVPRGAIDESSLRRAGRHLEGAILAEPFDPGSHSALVSAFVRRHREGFGRDPGVFAAQAYDATLLALAEMARGASDRDALLRALLTVIESPGAAGATTVTPDGGSTKRSSLLAVRNGTLVRIGSGAGR